MATERKIRSVTREAVLSAILECDEMTPQAFLKKYGFGRPRNGFVYHEGKAYAAMALMAAAFGYLPGRPAPLSKAEIKGGLTGVKPAFRKLGFIVEEPYGFQPPLYIPQEKQAKNPLWTREQVILALDLYVKHKGRDPGSAHPDVLEVSALLRQMATEAGLTTYRNAAGVIMKMMNFRSIDPTFTGKGLKGASNLDKAVWAEFYGKSLELAIAAEAIREGTYANMDEAMLDDVQSYEAKEGKVSYRYHRTLERDRKVVAIRKTSALKLHGRLECEGCGFDFAATYGARGHGFIEAHHTNPVHAMQEGDVTTPDDLALICSNCHRMIHKAKPWLSLVELRTLLSNEA